MLEIADYQHASTGHDRFQCSTAAEPLIAVEPRPLHSRLEVSPFPKPRSSSIPVIADCDFEKDNAYDEVLTRIGRNLLLFQKAEELIKCLLTMGSADPSEGFEQQGAVWQKHTLDQLKNQLTDRPHTQDEQRRESIDLLAQEQNHFSSDLLPSLMPDTLANFRSLAAALDEQRETILPEIKRLIEDTVVLQGHLRGMLAAKITCYRER